MRLGAFAKMGNERGMRGQEAFRDKVCSRTASWVAVNAMNSDFCSTVPKDERRTFAEIQISKGVKDSRVLGHSL